MIANTEYRMLTLLSQLNVYDKNAQTLERKTWYSFYLYDAHHLSGGKWDVMFLTKSKPTTDVVTRSFLWSYVCSFCKKTTDWIKMQSQKRAILLYKSDSRGLCHVLTMFRNHICIATVRGNGRCTSQCLHVNCSRECYENIFSCFAVLSESSGD